MEDRYKLLEAVRVRNIESFNRLGATSVVERLKGAGMAEAELKETPTFLPYIVLIVDEMASLMQSAKKQVEMTITQIAQKARAVGIHLVCATQSPRADIITGQIKANMTARIAFRVTSQIESRIILDQGGADKLLGKGDMLVMLPGGFQPVRAQCTFVSDDEVTRLVDFLRSQGKPEYHAKLMEIDTTFSSEGTEQDDQYEDAVEVIVMEQRGSVSLLQRKLGIGYGRAARLIDIMEKNHIVGPFVGEGTPRQVLVSREQWEARRRTPA
jgi:S-DNA-T family DNA segregation ATPase FtsK/SpoIIIE